MSVYCLRVTRGDTNVECHECLVDLTNVVSVSDMCLVDLNECLLPEMLLVSRYVSCDKRRHTNVVSVTICVL